MLTFLHPESSDYFKAFTDLRLSGWKVINVSLPPTFFSLSCRALLRFFNQQNYFNMKWFLTISLFESQRLFNGLYLNDIISGIKYYSFEIWYWVLCVRLWRGSGYSILLPLNVESSACHILCLIGPEYSVSFVSCSLLFLFIK